MSQDVTDFAAVMMVIIASIGALSIIGLASWRIFRRNAHPQALPPPRYDEQLAQLQHSVDAMALEIERIAEGQRFSTRLLSEGTRNKELPELR